jgi:hypothetical protein
MSFISKKVGVRLAAVAAAVAFGSSAALAQDLNPGVSCIDGVVAEADWNEFYSNYRESIWDKKAGVRLRAEDAPLELTVTDGYGNTVCEAIADDRARCKFTIPVDYEGTFVMKVLNTDPIGGNRGFKLCAE